MDRSCRYFFFFFFFFFFFSFFFFSFFSFFFLYVLKTATEPMEFEESKTSFRQLLSELPADNQQLLESFLTLLHEVSEKSDANFMTPRNLAIVVSATKR